MTEIEKAIEALESSGDYMETCDCEECSWKHTAITALREKAERVEGCRACINKWCDTCKNHGVNCIGCVIHTDIAEENLYRPNNYCHMCGRRLTQNDSD